VCDLEDLGRGDEMRRRWNDVDVSVGEERVTVSFAGPTFSVRGGVTISESFVVCDIVFILSEALCL
jgi:hypothetical protein